MVKRVWAQVDVAAFLERFTTGCHFGQTDLFRFGLLLRSLTHSSPFWSQYFPTTTTGCPSGEEPSWRCQKIELGGGTPSGGDGDDDNDEEENEEEEVGRLLQESDDDENEEEDEEEVGRLLQEQDEEDEEEEEEEEEEKEDLFRQDLADGSASLHRLLPEDAIVMVVWHGKRIYK
ncbi:hypothetical protein COCMIDRAFT_27850 [Bipolaris oryzae ATCC 44560]|uniref:Uncharacterized protein n=1 Tax=Bipolaris oryzae ATCC 44560 TaxID=930090 RepID=W6YWH8_COCMI|nr:uncharacterized protein COCMIDRAFT_27850 [Bipolaris oryzae ATCC 44560]EUC43722.1 hypothetical protein COCMIDRAFT_27850 [Bipolaris oryzae ATCC 44560]